LSVVDHDLQLHDLAVGCIAQPTGGFQHPAIGERHPGSRTAPRSTNAMNSPASQMRLYVNHGSIRPAPSVADQPAVVMLQWRVVRFLSGECVLVGFLGDSSVIRVTTQIVSAKGRQVWTRSGRCYELPYGPATDEEVVALLCERLAPHGDYVDVTKTFEAMLGMT
jgi:hypothetical protein